MNDLSNPKNKECFAIVSVGYNRLDSQRRLLEMLEKADYSGYENVPLIISIDCSGDQPLYDYARNFEWSHGDKYVIIREKRMGLKEHILACGDLSKYFKGIILLEDDLYLSKWFYHYIMQMNEVYGKCENVASIGMYSNEVNGFCWLPFDRLQNEADVFAIQSVCTSGEAWNAEMWAKFREWYNKTEIDWDDLDVPEKEKLWTKAWSKFFDAYLVMNDKFSIFPNVSLSTNFGDAGEHGRAQEDSMRIQVTIQDGKRVFQTLPFEKLLKYDAHFNSMNLYETLGINREDVCIDLYGDRENRYNKKYYLSVKPMPYKLIKSFGLAMRPIEANVINNIPGNDIFLYDTTMKANKPKSNGITHRVMYYQKGFNSLLLWPLIKGNVGFLFATAINRINRKLKRK